MAFQAYSCDGCSSDYPFLFYLLNYLFVADYKKFIVDFAEQTNDPKLFKKLQNDVWVFRKKYAGLQIRLLAFWEKTDYKEVMSQK